MKFTDKELLIFDFDGTLIDSVPDLADALNKMLTQINKEPFEEDTIRYWVGNGAQTLVKRALLGKNDISDFQEDTEFTQALSLFLSLYKEMLCNKTVMYDGVAQTLQKLKADGYRLTIVTNKPYDFIEPILERLGLSGLFELLLGGDSLPEKKPSPLPLLHICEKLAVAKERTLMIGDSKNDILAAKNAGVESIAVSYGYNYGEDIRTYHPSAVIDTFADLTTLLEK
ncbi:MULTISPECIES: phosphoglycolate phosphatase [Sulfurimonas]|uniref:phosphoglycolate phosphatase n=1 Tax=Sulfurimonas TaxID=202746 RepID=UPI0012650B0E|nr:phosphoglycolate phosphatase [Sulfurimonas indica]